ncbi:hypothetical protein [Thermogemmatispora tikiterensis]|uniref:Uncharacterized protein n=1 Tax=Thermogemmatispora tikiterensis TaxID=1825093 RepID=A0A328VET6_9CHLR|nr:hypothetical protein [Thermogemmatispora tikiterensis]RAQ96057.1 hypothetical protein A4R35_10980 [Thermogemmatispora tikiterensis]
MTLERTVWLQERRRLTAERYDQPAPSYDRDSSLANMPITAAITPIPPWSKCGSGLPLSA